MTRVSICKCGVDSGEVEPSQANTNKEGLPQKRYSFARNLKNYVLEFCREGSLHGVKYLGQNRTIIEKIWWALSMAVSLYLCIILVLSAYDKWERSPVIVSFATKETPIWQVPFPAVTVCPETKALPKKYNFSHYVQQKKGRKVLTKEEDKQFGYVSLICNYEHDINYTLIEDKFSEGNEVLEFLHGIQPDFYKMVSECQYMGFSENCSDLFFPVITDEGICYTFNLLDRSQLYRDNVVQFKNYHKAPLSNWSIQYGYHLEDDMFTYPRRALLAGAVFALEAKFTIFDEELEYSCGSSIQGYKVQISHPSRIPRVKDQHFRIPLDTAIIAAIAPDMTVTSDAVRNYNPRKRNCYLPNERPLKYFRLYTQQNCQIECKTNYTIKKCGCTNFYMPRDNETKICTGGKLDCIYESENHLLFHGINKKLKILRQGKQSKGTDKCDCLPICTSMYYNVENSESTWNWRKHYPTKSDTKHMSYFQVFFKGNQFITMERNELFGVTDFLANFGGLLGLFVGFSMLSLIEIVYYCTLRIICNIKMFGSNNWSGSPDSK